MQKFTANCSTIRFFYYKITPLVMNLFPISSVPDSSELSSKLVLKRDTVPQMLSFFCEEKIKTL